MAVYANNILQAVQTYNKANLALLQNLTCAIATSNTQFKEFNDIGANLGSSVSFDLPPRFSTVSGLVAAYQPLVQRVATLTCDQSANTSYSATATQRIFNIDKPDSDDGIGQYMNMFGRSAIAQLAAKVEINVQLNAISGVTSSLTGALNTGSGPYRYYGNGTTQITSYQQLATAMMFYRNYGAPYVGTKFYLPDTIIPSIVGNGLNQFAPNRNNEIAMSWEVGDFGTPLVKYYSSNLLPIHVSGDVGVNNTTLTVVSVNDPTGQNVTTITVSGATNNDQNAVFAGDLFQFVDGVSSFPNMRYLTFIGEGVSASPVQIRATQNAVANGSGQVTISFTPALNWAGGQNQNLNNPIQAGMQLTSPPSHRAGVIIGGDANYLAMPTLPDQNPFPTASDMDPKTKVAMRMTHGSLIGQNQTATIWDCTWGSLWVPEYTMRLLVPLSQG